MSEFWRIECEGGCGRYIETARLTVLWTTSRRCPECREESDE